MNARIVERIERLKREKNAIILAHNYERPEVVDIADVTGGSFGLLSAAMETSTDVIVVCSVDFMAEAAAILNPDKRVITPTRDAICPLARQLKKKELIKAKREHPDAHVLLYMNSDTKTKALEILRQAEEKELTSGRGPTGVAAAAIYIASILCGERRTQREVADVAGVTEVTIRNRYKELAEELDLDIVL